MTRRASLRISAERLERGAQRERQIPVDVCIDAGEREPEDVGPAVDDEKRLPRRGVDAGSCSAV